MSVQTLGEGDICMVIPASVASGEPGDPLSDTCKNLIVHMAEAGYWPVDFGESTDNAIELWFSCNATAHMSAADLAEHFIQTNGG